MFALPLLAAAWRCGAPGRLAGAAACGFVVTLCWAHQALDQRLPEGAAGVGWIEGRVSGLPQRRGAATRFLLRVDTWEAHLALPGTRPTVRLSWRDPAAVATGTRWRLLVRLRSPRGFANPAGFDYERYCLRHGIAALGYVLANRGNREQREARWSIDGLRARLAARIAARLGEHDGLGLVQALVLGIRAHIPQHQWQQLTRTGTGHLIAISGLHIGLVATLCFFIGRWLASLAVPFNPATVAQRWGAVCGLSGALIYAALAGFALPTQRALIMSAVVLGRVALGLPPWSLGGFFLALLSIVLADPAAPLDAGFWLSFGAVAVIVATLRRGGRGWRVWLRVQLAVACVMAPLTALWFGSVSLVSPLANLLAIPWVSLLIVPVALLGLLLCALQLGGGALLLGLAADQLALLMRALALLAALPQAQIPAAADWLRCALAFGALLLLVGPAGIPGRRLALLMLLASLWPRADRPPPGSFEVTLLDVGQGLSAVVMTRRHVLVYDLGPRLSPRLDTGSAVVLPYLRRRGVAAIDRLVLSHGDNDHRGGFEGIAGRIPIGRVLAGDPGALAELSGTPLTPCRAGTGWRWDGVRFEVLHPGAGRAWQGNDASCVIRVGNGRRALLLTGDIERRAEAALLETAADRLAAEVLIAPHHGSRTSSTAAFIAAVAPQLVLIPAGRGNRYGFPHEAALATYRAAGAATLSSGAAGAIRLSVGDRVGWPRSARRHDRRYWHHPAR